MQNLKFYQMPTALERAGDFSQSVTPSGALIPVRDPVTNAPFPGNRIPANRLDPRGQAFLNLYPMPNTTGVNGYNYVTQEPSIDWPRRQHMFRGDYRPTDRDSIAVKYQTFYTRSVGINVDGASARWGLVRQRYDFDVDIGKIDYTRILNTSTILEFSTGFFNSIENGPPEDDVALARHPARDVSAARTGSDSSQGSTTRSVSFRSAVFGNIQSADRAQSNDGGTAWVTYDGRWPIYGNDIAINAAVNLTHTRGRHTYKMGIMREDELFSQARSGTFGGRVQLRRRRPASEPHGLRLGERRARPGPQLHGIDGPRARRSPSEDLGVVRAGHLEAHARRSRWTSAPHVQVGAGTRAGRRELGLQRGAIRSGVGRQSACVLPAGAGRQRRARHGTRVTGQVLPATFIGLIVPGTGYTCTQVITAQTLRARSTAS